MPAGAQILDAAGNEVFSPTSRVLKFFGSASVGWSFTGATQSGVITDARFGQFPLNTPFVLMVSGVVDFDGRMAMLSVVGNDVQWSYAYAAAASFNRPDCSFVYGIF